MITVYVLRGAARRYVGITNDLARRLAEHRGGSHSGKLIGDFVVLHTETFPDYATARSREKFLKSGQGRAWLDERFGKS
jgi:putative endonuclease